MWNIIISWIEQWWQRHYEQHSERATPITACTPGNMPELTYRFQQHR